MSRVVINIIMCVCIFGMSFAVGTMNMVTKNETIKIQKKYKNDDGYYFLYDKGAVEIGEASYNRFSVGNYVKYKHTYVINNTIDNITVTIFVIFLIICALILFGLMANC